LLLHSQFDLSAQRGVLYQAGFNGAVYQYGYNSAPTLAIKGAPEDTDWERWSISSRRLSLSPLFYGHWKIRHIVSVWL